ncbi:MAG: FtsQ-type POTRA domain-containing protein [Ruminiclostridium sp.]|nr:FtsQ-type POTRA domain-containing protein [Ruminiclostridium sp.]
MRKQTINESMELKAENRKRNRKRIKRLIFWIKSISILALFIVAIIFTGLSPLFDLKEIEVKGAVHYKPEILSGYADIQLGENGFSEIGSSPLDIMLFRFGNAETSIMRNCPYVREAVVRFAIPSKVVINVTERTAAAAVPYLGTSLLIDEEGYVLESLAADKKTALLSVRGLEFIDYGLGKKLDIKNEDSLTTAMNLVKALKENDKSDKIKIFKLVDAVDVSDRSNIKISLESRVTVNLGDLEDLNYRISTAKTIFNRNIKKGEKGTLDFTAGENPVFSPLTAAKTSY